MKIVVGFLRSPEGHVALDRALDEAKLRDATQPAITRTR